MKSKKRQKKLIIEIMRDDEKLGLYTDLSKNKPQKSVKKPKKNRK